MRIYITASFRNGDNKEEIDELCEIIRRSWFDDYCFVRDEKNYWNPYELMQLARQRISECDIVLMNYDGPSHGRMIEIWIAYAMQKKIIIIAKKWIKIKDTVIWISDLIIEYDKLEDIINKIHLTYI